MCNAACVKFGIDYLNKSDIYGKRVIEIGSLDINGSLRTDIEKYEPKEYIGVDIKKGPGVDIICSVYDLVDKFGFERFDLIISTELLEHVKDWKIAIKNMKNILAKEGKIILTTRSYGFPYHAFPYDFWRYEEEDIKRIFSDFRINVSMSDPTPNCPGVFCIVQKPSNFEGNNLNRYTLFSMIKNRRVKNITNYNLYLHILLQKIIIPLKVSTYSTIKQITKKILNK